ncbi:tRNA modification GTPase TrmE [Mycena maculata]|uniref:tRNA modification GTPase TrmE n=1 Tax=Mycena maculata TaxID=230809 RepID=A0AAD7NIR1_9AGAR|nr:tRNA modification GTPase TrmE [Mycena maculata]
MKPGRLADPVLSDAQRSTIYALSTPPGKAGVAVVRVSGPRALDVCSRLVKRRAVDPIEPWKMQRCHIVHPETGEILDDGLAVFFKGPKSFTTEDVLELHIHSGRAIISSVLTALSKLLWCRPAEPGEFTRRAFEGGRLDLTQVEGLKDLIDAETEGQRRIALRAAGGTARAQFEQLRTEIIGCLAKIEALIDFGEGEDIEEGVYEEARERASKLKDTIQSYLQDNRRGEIMRTGVRLTIFGPPNAGKSSLLNFLAQREAAIVTPVPGTTRDILEVSLDIGGIPVIVADTAGLRKTDDLVEVIGVERARTAVQVADIALCVVSCAEIHRPPGDENSVQFPPSVRPLITDDTFVLFNKIDLDSGDPSRFQGPRRWVTSLKTRQGTARFLDGFAKALQKRYALDDDPASTHTPLITHARHRVHLASAAQFIDAFLATSVEDIVLGAEELRYAARAVGKVSGLIDVEDVLDALFRDFCIGK